MRTTSTAPPIDPEASPFEPSRLLAELTREWTEAGPIDLDKLPKRLDLDDITLCPELFQPRAMDQKHISDLGRVIGNNGVADPVTVLAAGQPKAEGVPSKAVLVDGHHRIEAYRRAKGTLAVPVRYFRGTPQQAVLEAAAANSKAKLVMLNHERQNFAWKLVLMGGYAKAAIAKASGISERQVAYMRDAARKLGPKAFDHVHWWRAREAAKGHEFGYPERTPEETAEWLDSVAQDYADRLAKEFSTKLSRFPEMAARAFSIYFGEEKLDELFRRLKEHVSLDVLRETGEDEF